MIETAYQKQTFRHCWIDKVAPIVRREVNKTRNAEAMVHSEYSQLDISKFDEASRYGLMMGTDFPRPIALVTSLSRDCVLNAASFTQFVVISVTPLLPGFVAHEGEYGLKDTVRNLLESVE